MYALSVNDVDQVSGGLTGSDVMGAVAGVAVGFGVALAGVGTAGAVLIPAAIGLAVSQGFEETGNTNFGGGDLNISGVVQKE